jgi:multiple RNA-binding domain-containing protein 1
VIDFEALDRNPRASCKRSDTVILIKNIPATAKEAELKELFERYGSLVRFLVSPFNTLAIAEYADSSQARSALKNLAYHKVNFITPIYLEMAPTGLVKAKLNKEIEVKEA